MVLKLSIIPQALQSGLLPWLSYFFRKNDGAQDVVYMVFESMNVIQILLTALSTRHFGGKVYKLATSQPTPTGAKATESLNELRTEIAGIRGSICTSVLICGLQVCWPFLRRQSIYIKPLFYCLGCTVSYNMVASLK